jgi:type I restriction enzyme S subunit
MVDWQEINIGNDTTLKARIGWQGLTTGEYKDSGKYYLVTGTDFENGFVNWDTCHFVDKWRFDQDKNIQLRVNDVLITKDGTIGKAGFINTIKLPTTLNSGVFVIRTNSDKLDQKYLYYIFTSEIFDDFLNRLTAGSTINHLYQKDFIHFTFKAPKIKEQKAIAKALSDTDELITSIEKLISKKEAIKQGTMQQLLTGKKRLSGFSGEWEEKRLGDIFEITAGGDLKKDLFSENKDEIYKFSIYANSIFQKGLYGYSTFNNIDKESITVTARGTLGVAFHRKTSYVAIGRLLILQPKIKLNCLFCTESINLTLNFANESTSVPQLTAPQISNYNIFLPENIEEQQAIAQIISDMDKEIETLKLRLSKTKAIKDGMMSELLTGKTRLKGVYIE